MQSQPVIHPLRGSQGLWCVKGARLIFGICVGSSVFHDRDCLHFAGDLATLSLGLSGFELGVGVLGVFQGDFLSW